MELNSQQNEFFSAMEDTFRTPGWALLQQGWREEQQTLPERMFYNAKTVEEMGEARVRHGLLNELLSLPETIAAQKAQILSMDSE